MNNYHGNISIYDGSIFLRICEKLCSVITIFLKIWIISALVLFSLIGCSRPLPFTGPYEGYVIDSTTGKPIEGAIVEAEWWCHDSPLPDGPGSFFIRTSSICDTNGFFRIEQETRRGGYFGSNFALKFKAKGYIPATLIGDISNTPLPSSTISYPFIDTIKYESFPSALHIKIKPAGPVFLKLISSENVSYRKRAKEGLQKLLGVNYGYDADKWGEALRSWESGSFSKSENRNSEDTVPCQCAEFVPKNRPPKWQISLNRKLIVSAIHEPVSVLKELILKGAEINARNSSGITPLMNASSYGGKTENVIFLLSHGADIDARSGRCETALMRAAQSGHADAVKILLDKGADINLKDKDCETALFKALLGRRTEIVEILREFGAKR